MRKESNRERKYDDDDDDYWKEMVNGIDSLSEREMEPLIALERGERESCQHLMACKKHQLDNPLSMLLLVRNVIHA